MKLDLLKEEYSKVKLTENFSEHNNFIKNLVQENSEDVLVFHFNIMNDRENKTLHRRVCKSFEKRGAIGAEFLLKKIETNQSDELKADIIQTLGIMRNKRILEFIPEFIKDENDLIRFKAIIVLGWVGDTQHLKLLNSILLNDKESYLRGYAATSMRQIWYKNKEGQDEILSYVINALYKEDSKDTIALLILVIQDLLKRKFGLQELQDGTIKGNVVKAKEKVLEFIN